MKLILFCFIFGIVNACDFIKPKKNTKKLIQMDFVSNGGYYNFKSLKLTFPKLDQIFDCVTNQGDMVNVEVFYKFKDEQADFVSIGDHVLTYQKYGQSLQSVHVIGPSNDDLVKPCRKIGNVQFLE